MTWPLLLRAGQSNCDLGIDLMPSINVSMENFQSDVVDASQNMPVVLLFWAEQVPESAHVKLSLIHI